MERIGEKAARAFKALAGQDRDEPMSSQVIALYSFLFVVGMPLVLSWVMAASM